MDRDGEISALRRVAERPSADGTWDELVAAAEADLALHGRCAVWKVRNMMGEVMEAHHLPIARLDWHPPNSNYARGYYVYRDEKFAPEVVIDGADVFFRGRAA